MNTLEKVLAGGAVLGVTYLLFGPKKARAAAPSGEHRFIGYRVSRSNDAYRWQVLDTGGEPFDDGFAANASDARDLAIARIDQLLGVPGSAKESLAKSLTRIGVWSVTFVEVGPLGDSEGSWDVYCNDADFYLDRNQQMGGLVPTLDDARTAAAAWIAEFGDAETHAQACQGAA